MPDDLVTALHAAAKCPLPAEKCPSPAEKCPSPGPDGDQAQAVTLWFELETRCNLRCRFCYNFWKDGTSPEPTRMDTVRALACIDRLFAQARVGQIAFSGGEPLLREDLELLIARAKSFGTEVVVTTNGTLLSAARMATLVEAGADLFQIPLLSAGRQRHDHLSGRPSWDAALAAFRRLVAARIPVYPVFVATAVNAGDLEEVLELCAGLGLDRLIVNWFIPGGLGLANRAELELSAEAMGAILLAADRTAGALGMTIELGTPVPLTADRRRRLTSTNPTSCPIARRQRHFTLDAAGNLKRCNHSPEVLGPLLSEDLDRLRARALPPADPAPGALQACRFACRG